MTDSSGWSRDEEQKLMNIMRELLFNSSVVTFQDLWRCVFAALAAVGVHRSHSSIKKHWRQHLHTTIGYDVQGVLNARAKAQEEDQKAKASVATNKDQGVGDDLGLARLSVGGGEEHGADGSEKEDTGATIAAPAPTSPRNDATLEAIADTSAGDLVGALIDAPAGASTGAPTGPRSDTPTGDAGGGPPGDTAGDQADDPTDPPGDTTAKLSGGASASPSTDGSTSALPTASIKEIAQSNIGRLNETIPGATGQGRFYGSHEPLTELAHPRAYYPGRGTNPAQELLWFGDLEDSFDLPEHERERRWRSRHGIWDTAPNCYPPKNGRGRYQWQM